MFLFAECLCDQSLALPVWQRLMGNAYLTKRKVKVVFRQKLGNLKHPQPHEIFQVLEIRSIGPLSVYVLDVDQVAVHVIRAEMRSTVEPDHDPVGGCSSGVSLLD